jgi:integrase
MLGQECHDDGLVFCRLDGKPCDPTEFTRHFKRVLQRAGLPPLRLHDARHTFATLMLELGEHPKTVQSLLGRSSVTITLDIYSHVSLELETRATAELDAAVMGSS